MKPDYHFSITITKQGIAIYFNKIMYAKTQKKKKENDYEKQFTYQCEHQSAFNEGFYK